MSTREKLRLERRPLAFVLAAVAFAAAPAPALAGGAPPRVFVNEIFSFDPIGDAYDAEFRNYIDACAAIGFDTIRIDIPWDQAEVLPGVFAWKRFDDQLDYVVADGMKLMLIVNTRDKPLWLIDPAHPADGIDSYLMRYSDGTVHHGNVDVRIGGKPITQHGTLTLNDDAVRTQISDFHAEVVARYQARYAPGTVLNYISCFNPTMEDEYDNGRYLDFSRYAKAEYRTWLRKRYGSIAALNARWRTSFATFEQIVPFVDPAAIKPDRDPRFHDWIAFRSFSLKRFFDTMADRVHATDARAEYGIQLGGGMWDAPWKRNTFEIEAFAEKCDWLIIDFQQAFPSTFLADVNRGTLPGKKLVAELDGPQRGYTDAQFLAAGKAAYNRGYVGVELANFAFLGVAELQDPKWTFLGKLAAMGRGTTTVVSPVGRIDRKASNLYAWHDGYAWRDSLYAAWKAMTGNGATIADVVVDDDLVR